jgi:hypothetical protein
MRAGQWVIVPFWILTLRKRVSVESTADANAVVSSGETPMPDDADMILVRE